MLRVRLSESLCLWPREGAPPASPRVDETLDPMMRVALEAIDQRLDDPPSLEELAELAAYSTRHFSRRFHATFGCTPHTYITARRFAAARQMLLEDRQSVGQIAQTLGFGAVATFSRWFTQHAGMSPTALRHDPQVM